MFTPTAATKTKLNPSQFLYRCFNLRRRLDRRFCLLQATPEPILSRLRIVDAIDGQTLSAKNLDRWRIEPSKYAINLGKRIAIREFLQSDAEALVLLEDDVCFVPHFWEKFHAFLAAVPDDWGLLFLGGGHIESPTPLADPSVVRCRQVNGNHAWIIRRWCAPKLLRSLGKKPFGDNYSDMIIASLMSEIPSYAPASWLAFQRRSESDNGFGLVNQPLWENIGPVRPWIHDDELAVIRSAIKPGMRLLEWGAGGSTLFLADCCGPSGQLESIEHNGNHAAQVNQHLYDAGFAAFAHVHTVPRNAGRCTNNTALTQFHRYIHKAHELADPAFDACLVDGEDRIHCALAAAQVLKRGAPLFFHDFASPERGSYRHSLPALLEHYRLLLEVTHTPSTMSVFERL